MYFTPRSRAAAVSLTARCSIPLIVTMTLGYGTGAVAQGGLSEAAYLEDVPVVLSAARLAQPVTEAPAAVTIIDREMIEASGARQIADLFRLVPGFTVAYMNGYTPSVTYHGFADEYSRRMQVMIDGRSVYLPSIGGVDWSNLPITLDDIEHIEVIRGPDSAAYGANSFLGVISITTRQPVEDKGTAVNANFGTHNVRDGSLRYGDVSNALAYHLTLGYHQDDGFDNRYDTQKVQLLNGRISYQLTARDALEGQFGLSGGPHQIGFEDSTFDPPHTNKINTNFQQIHWLHNTTSGQEFSVRFYHNYHDTNEEFTSLPIIELGGAQTPLNADVTAERYDLEFQHTLAPAQDLRLVWGASARLDTVIAPTFFSTTATQKNSLYRVFGNLEWHIDPTLIGNFGATFEHNNITGSDVSPRVALNYHLSNHHTLRAVISEATRTPLLFEDQGNWKLTVGPITDQILLGSGRLDSERILSREIGYLYNLPEHGTSLDVKVFYDRLNNLVRADYICLQSEPYCSAYQSGVIDTIDGNYQYVHNVDSATVHGIEFQLDQHIGANTRIVTGYARTLINNDSLRSPFQSAPRDSFHLMLIQHIKTDTLASVAYYQNDDMEYLGSGNHTDIQRRLDLRLGHTFRLDTDKFTAALIIQNLLGSYQDFLYSKDTKNLFDRRAFIQIGYQLP